MAHYHKSLSSYTSNKRAANVPRFTVTNMAAKCIFLIWMMDHNHKSLSTYTSNDGVASEARFTLANMAAKYKNPKIFLITIKVDLPMHLTRGLPV